MAHFHPLKNWFATKVPESTTWVQRGGDRRKTDLGRTSDRRKSTDRRNTQPGSKNYEYVGLNLGGWIELEE